MQIEHIAIWVRDLEKTKNFYTTFFNMRYGEKYVNVKKQFSSYFLAFEGGARIEIMHRPDIREQAEKAGTFFGVSHFAISVGSRERVDELQNPSGRQVLKSQVSQEPQERAITKV